MTKLQAIQILMRDVNNERPSKTSLSRVRAACKTLGLNPEEVRQIEADLEYREAVNGELYRDYL